ncbi:collagen alpha-1(XI) chain-like [Sycon ciliatum]|uniref:collagen alpha-1(XI) chain-like n=1 Tax=Sycon ciliatum TaxID=27933 RepID=UPI0031F6523A
MATTQHRQFTCQYSSISAACCSSAANAPVSKWRWSFVFLTAVLLSVTVTPAKCSAHEQRQRRAASTSSSTRERQTKSDSNFKHFAAKIVRKPYNFTEDVVVKGISVHDDIYNEVVFLRHILNFVVLPGDGSDTRPARTCRDLMIAHPGFLDGFYYVDPNGGSTADKIQVYCNFTGGGWTVLEPSVRRSRMAALSQRGVKGYDNYTWYSTMDRHFKVDYPSESQLRLLRAQSTLSRQLLTFRCARRSVFPRTQVSSGQAPEAVHLRGNDHSIISTSGDRHVEVDARRNDCDERVAKGRTVLQLSAYGAAMARLPVHDFALHDFKPYIHMAVINKATLMFL